jgi:3-hydroxyisobutyrate dehydrogenase
LSDQAAGPVVLVGLGRMGLPMARRLLEAGWRVHGVDLAAAARDALAAAGGSAHAGLGAALAAAGACRFVLTILPDGAAVRRALLAGAAQLQPGTLVIEMSSSAPADTLALAADLARLGVAVVDAPVSGGVRKAADGTLTVMAGGDPAAIDSARPLLQVLSARIFPTGPLGSGHAMKALNNFVSAAGFAAAAEALLVAARYGLASETVIDILNASTGRNNSTELKMKQFVLAGSFASGFSIGLMAKDLRTAAELAGQLAVEAPVLREMAVHWRDAAAALGGEVDHTAYYRFAAGTLD